MIRWLNATFPKGIYAGPARSVVVWCDDHLCLNRRVHACVRKRLKLGDEANSPAWVSELYQLCALSVAVVLVVLCRYLPDGWRAIPAVIALYRPFEIALFTSAWIFARGAEALSTKRSVVGLLINLAEVILTFGCAYLGFGCAEGIPTALYSSLRILVTIGPIATNELPGHAGCGGFVAGEIVVAYYLVVVIVASTVGALRDSR